MTVLVPNCENTFMGGNWQTVDYVITLYFDAIAKHAHECNLMNVMYYATLRNFLSSFSLFGSHNRESHKHGVDKL